MTLVERSSAFLERHLSRRSFLVRGTFAATALAVSPKRYVLEPGTAYEALCGGACGNPNCGCGSTCCQGYSTFCCTVNGGRNFCPEGSVVGGWWAAKDSSFCGNGTRYYLDCNGTCHCETGCGSYYSNGGTFCDPACDGLHCHCEADNCNHWVESCFQFRYGQCNTHVGCTGRIICRMVSCVEPWKLDIGCGSSYMWDSSTAEMNAPCNTRVPAVPCDSTATRCETAGLASPPTGHGYWIATSYGKVIRFGSLAFHGDLAGHTLPSPIVAMQSSPDGGGYFLAAADGAVYHFGDAVFAGSAAGEHLPAPVTAMALTPAGDGYWLVLADGGVHSFGSASFHGSLRGETGTRVVGVDSSPTGGGYWLVTESGSVHAFGDARWHGSPFGLHPAHPVVGIRRSQGGAGYLVLGERGAVWAFGDAVDCGQPLDRLGRYDTVSLETCPKKGYWVVARDGAVYSYGDAFYHGGAN